MKKLILMTVAIMMLSIFVSAGSCIAAPKTVLLSCATSSIGGVWNVIGATIADLVKNKLSNIKITAEVTGGGVDNLKLLATKQVDLGMGIADTVYMSYKGEGIFKGKPNHDLRAIMGGDMLYAQFYTLKKNGIKNLADLKGKKISIGAIGSVSNNIIIEVLKSYGLEIKKDWTPEYLGHQDGADALVDGHVDVVLYTGTLKASAPFSTAQSHEVEFISIDAKNRDELTKKFPYWAKDVVPANTYKGQTKAIETIGIPTILCVDANVDKDIVYNISKVIFENPDIFCKAHSSGAEWVIENVKRGPVGVLPYHPGTEKYLKEKGIL